MTLNKENYIDLYNREYVVFHANQFDHETRTITLIPKNESQLVSLRNYIPRLLYYKPDGHACFYDLSYNEDDSITILLTEQMLSVSGDCLGQLYLSDPSTGEVITSTTFVIKVAKRNNADKIIESSDEFDALNQMVTRVENVVDKADTLDEMITTSEQILEKTQTAYDNAVNAINTAESINSTAEESARLAKESEENAADSQKEANRHALMSESYFHGGTGIREGEDEENVLSFYEKIQSIADSNIATEAKAGLVKASEDVNVSSDGTMSIPKLPQLESLIKGASSAKVFETLEEMVTQLNDASLADFTVGTNLLIKAVNVPDFWISEIHTENIPYTWINDEDFINNIHSSLLPANASIQIGYYGISFLETDKVDLTGIAKESYVDGKFAQAQSLSNTNFASAKEYTDNKISGIANTQTPTFLEADTRENIVSGEKLSTIFGKIRKWFSDLKTVAFTGSYTDLANKPAIPTVPSSLPANGGNADTVDGLHGWQLGTLNENGQSYGARFPLVCKWRAFGDSRYGLYVDEYETRVHYASAADSASNDGAGNNIVNTYATKSELSSTQIKVVNVKYAMTGTGAHEATIYYRDHGFTQCPSWNLYSSNLENTYSYDCYADGNIIKIYTRRTSGHGQDTDSFFIHMVGI